MSEAVFSADAILFDMDGTLVDSTAGVVGAWETFKKSYPGIDVKRILASSHGVRTIDNLRVYCGIEDPGLLESEARRFEEAIVTTSMKNGSRGIIMLPGVKAILDKIGPHRHLPSPKWAICTSATRSYAISALKSANIPQPEVLVVAEDVLKGKPQYANLAWFSLYFEFTKPGSPDPYILGARKCGVSPAKCVVFEDAPSGVRSGRAAGCKTIGLLTSHSREEMEAANPEILVQDLSSISVGFKESGELEIAVRIH